MGKYDGILICSDFDGTLFADGQISVENSEAIRYFQDNGGLFTIVSGRFPEFFDKYPEIVRPNTYIIGLNGGAICDPHSRERVYSGRLPDGTYKRADALLDKYEKLKQIHVFDKYNWQPVTREERGLELDTNQVSKLVFYVAREDSDEMKQVIKNEFSEAEYAVERSWINGIELLSSDANKGAGIRHLRRLLGDKVHTIIGVGDYENDISMIKEADIGYAVENACDELKALADRHTVHCRDHAIAKIISEL